MFFSKARRETEKEILSAGSDNSGESAIDVRVTAREQVFSPYSYSGDKLNLDFCDYIYEKAKNAPHSEDLSIRIFAEEQIDASEIDRTLKSHYCSEYREANRELKRTGTISLIMTLLGVVTLAIMVLLNYFWDNFYVTTIVEIAAWVFVWEAVDYFFLQRPLIKAKLLLIQRIYRAKIEVSVNN